MRRYFSGELWSVVNFSDSENILLQVFFLQEGGQRHREDMFTNMATEINLP